MFYLLQVTICWACFYGLYVLLYSRETFFQLNRFYLLATLLLGVLLPLDWAKIWLQPSATTEVAAVLLQPLIVNGELVASNVNAFAFDFENALFVIYCFGVLLTASRFLYGLFRIYQLVLKGEKTKYKNYNLLKTKELHLPFSFVNHIFVSSEITYEPVMEAQIMLHEAAHIRQKHSVDVLLLELLSIAFWCSPMVYFYKKSLRAVHEYLADDATTQRFSKHEYGTMLIRQTQSGKSFVLANSFIHSQLKKRFAMMLKPSSSRWAYCKYGVCVPILLFLSVVLH